VNDLFSAVVEVIRTTRSLRRLVDAEGLSLVEERTDLNFQRYVHIPHPRTAVS
jgi:NAD(P)H-hydrate repair Nnr-like enzyme with NAD(P)H-hydrate dehydratase domain